MIRLAHKDLPEDVAKELAALQAKVDAMPTFAEKAAEAKRLWGTKGGVKGEEAFSEIKKILIDLSVFVQVCNYCEHSEGNDIEHIYPKAAFPEKTFVWDNYLLACPKCNTTHKSDKIDVLNDEDEVVRVSRHVEPPFKRVAFINPRQEDPSRFMILNLTTREFGLRDGLTQVEKGMATQTLEILQLNKRDLLKEARKQEERNYYNLLDRLRSVLKAKDVEEFADALDPIDDRFDFSKPLVELKEEAISDVKRNVQIHLHPSVWHSIKEIRSKTAPKWIQLFADLPFALQW